MIHGKRTISLITAVCFVMTSFFAIPSFATSAAEPIQALSPDGTDTSVTDSAVKIEPSAKTNTITGAAVVAASSSTTNAALSTTGAALSTTNAAISTTGTALSTTSGAIDAKKIKDDESLWYSSKIPMKKEHQKLLWDYCKKRKLDYIDMLALISLESNFNEKCSSRRYRGYFQISTAHGPNLSKTLKTLNKPLDGAININWGTAMYSWILADKRVKDLEGKKQRDVALSIFQQGSGGYNKRGLSTSYLKKYYYKRDIIVSYFKKKE